MLATMKLHRHSQHTLYTVTGEEVIAPERQEDIRYNLVGQMVDKNYKGLVIANGKKLFVK